MFSEAEKKKVLKKLRRTTHHRQFFEQLEKNAQELIAEVRRHANINTLKDEGPRVKEALLLSGGNKTKAARLLGWSRNKLRYVLGEQ
jgi:DNA-binding protein Fis